MNRALGFHLLSLFILSTACVGVVDEPQDMSEDSLLSPTPKVPSLDGPADDEGGDLAGPPDATDNLPLSRLCLHPQLAWTDADGVHGICDLNHPKQSRTTIVQAGHGDVYQVVAHGDYLYWFDSGRERFVRVSRSGYGSSETLPIRRLGIVHKFRIQGDYLYWVGKKRGGYTPEAEIYRVQIDDFAAVEKIADVQNSFASSLGVDDQYVYWIGSLSSDSFSKLFRKPKDGTGSAEALLDDLDQQSRGIFVDDRFIYWGSFSEQRIYRYAKKEQNRFTFVENQPMTRTFNLYKVGEHMYWNSCGFSCSGLDERVVRRKSLYQGGDPETVYSTLEHIDGFAVTYSDFVFSSPKTGVFSVQRGATEPSPHVIAARNPNHYFGVSLSPSHLYFSDREYGKISRIAAKNQAAVEMFFELPEPPRTTSPSARTISVFAHSGSVYWSYRKDIYQKQEDSATPSSTLGTHSQSSPYLARDASHFFVSSGRNISSLLASDVSTVTAYVSSDSTADASETYATSLAVDDRHVYFANGAIGLRRFPKSDFQLERIEDIELRSDDAISGVAVDDTYVYFGDKHEEALYRKRKDGSGDAEKLLDFVPDVRSIAVQP